VTAELESDVAKTAGFGCALMKALYFSICITPRYRFRCEWTRNPSLNIESDTYSAQDLDKNGVIHLDQSSHIHMEALSYNLIEG